MIRVHPSAVVDRDAVLEDGVEVGPLCVVGGGVRVGRNTRLVAQVSLQGALVMGADNIVYPFACLGADAQHRDAVPGEATTLEIGSGNVFREHVTVHRGTQGGSGRTVIGSQCLLMAGCHVAHDAVVGDGVVLTNHALLAGHVTVGDRAVVAGAAAVAQFVRLGESCFVAGNAMVERDVPPFLIAAGDRATLRAVNTVGLQRRGIASSSLRAVGDAFEALFPQHSRGSANCQKDPTDGSCAGLSWRRDVWVQRLLAFLEAPSRAGVMARRRIRAKS